MKPVIFEGKTYQFPDDATPEEIKSFLGGDKPADAKKPDAKQAPQGVTPEDRRAYTDASHTSGEPESMKKMKAIEDKYGGREKFIQMYDPLGEVLGKTALPAGAVMATGASAPWLLEAGAGAILSPEARSVGTEALKWLGRGALGAAGWDAARRITGGH